VCIMCLSTVQTGMLLSEDDAKKVAKMMENQISGLSRERKQAARQERADQERAQVRTSTLQRV
jgi:hypothetical protein